MAKLNVCCKLPSQTSARFQVQLESLDNKSESLYSEVKKQVKDGDFDIIYCGQVLKPDKSLASYSLQVLSTVYVVRKFTSRRPQTTEVTESTTSPSKHEVTMAIQSGLLNLDYRTIVEKMLNDPDSVENIITTTPGLDKDPAVLAMLQEPELLAVLAHPNNIESLLQQHPSFAQAAITIATAVNEEGAKSGGQSTSAGLSFSMDQMSDEDDDDMSMPHGSRARAQRGGVGGAQNITASQLAAALQAATGGASTSGASPPVAVMPSTSGAGPSSSGMAITSDFFQQAMAHAQSSSSDAALQQLRDMGITDENVARQALLATGGDIQAAIDLIFGDGMM